MVGASCCRSESPTLTCSRAAMAKLEANTTYQELNAITSVCLARWVNLRFGGDGELTSVSEARTRFPAAWQELESARNKSRTFVAKYLCNELRHEYEEKHMKSVTARPVHPTVEADTEDEQNLNDKNLRQHGDYRDELNSMVHARKGASGQHTTPKTIAFSKLTAKYKELYKSIADSDDVTGFQVYNLFQKMKTAEISSEIVPNHWLNRLDLCKCIICDCQINPREDYKHVLKCKLQAVKEWSVGEWNTSFHGFRCIIQGCEDLDLIEEVFESARHLRTHYSGNRHRYR
jgi:hypothetical protein